MAVSFRRAGRLMLSAENVKELCQSNLPSFCGKLFARQET